MAELGFRSFGCCCSCPGLLARGRKQGEDRGHESLQHVALELAKGICQVEDGGGTISLVIDIIDIFGGLFSFPVLTPCSKTQRKTGQGHAGTVPKLSKIVNTEDATRQDEAAPSPATLWSEKPAMPLLPGAWLQ